MGGKAINPTPSRNVRMSDDRWERLGQATDNRSEIINALVAYWLREPGAKLPPRPPAGT